MQPQAPHPASVRIRKTLGIDLGTTNSVIALLDPTDSTILTGQDEHGRRTFPSLVAWHTEHNRIVAGHAVGERGRVSAPSMSSRGADATPLNSVKRFMGLPREFSLGPKKLTPPEVSGCILRMLRDMMARTLND